MSEALNSTLPLPSLNKGGLAKNITPLWPYFAAIFGALLLWAIGVQILYAFIGSSDIAPAERANVLAIKMLVRLVIFLFFLVIIRIVQIALTQRRENIPGSLTSYITAKAKADPYWAPRKLALFLIGAIAFTWLQTNFMSVKTSIPDLVPFYLDEAARNLDRALFFGRDPWTVFAWIYEQEALIGIIDSLYTAWAGLIAGVWAYCFFSSRMNRIRRFQYIFAMILLWLIAGNLLAIALSSAGPCYYGLVTGDVAAYAPLMEKLTMADAVSPLGAFEYQDVLWFMHENPGSRFGGISAMPSLHVGSSLMLLILFWKTRIARELLIAFNIVIYIGSIVLAWHYAIDGLIVLPVVALCWWLGGVIARRVEAKVSSLQTAKPV